MRHKFVFSLQIFSFLLLYLKEDKKKEKQKKEILHYDRLFCVIYDFVKNAISFFWQLFIKFHKTKIYG